MPAVSRRALIFLLQQDEHCPEWQLPRLRSDYQPALPARSFATCLQTHCLYASRDQEITPLAEKLTATVTMLPVRLPEVALLGELVPVNGTSLIDEVCVCLSCELSLT